MSKRKQVFAYLFLLALFLATRIPYLNSGLLPMEPDEATYFDVVYNYHHGKNFPTRNNEPFLSQPPLFPILGYLAGFIFHPDRFQQNYLAGRTVSVFFWLMLAFSFYKLVRQTFDEPAAFFSTIFFILAPLGIFYSKLGLLDAVLTTFIFLYFIFLLRGAKGKKLKDFFIAGIFLSLAVITKYTSLIFFSLPFLFLTIDFLPKIKFQKKHPVWLSKLFLDDFNRHQAVRLALYYFLPIVMAGIIFFLALIPFIAKDAYVVKSTFLGVTISHAVKSPKSFFDNVFAYASNLFFWFSWPILLLSGLGAVRLLFYDLKKHGHFAAVLIFLLGLIGFVDKSPRTFFLLTPFILYLSAFGINAVNLMFFRVYPFFRDKPRKRDRPCLDLLLPIFLGSLVLFAIPNSLIALQSTNHRLLEKAARIIRQGSQNSKIWLFSTYWPGIMKHKTGLNSTWLTTQKEDSRNWHSSFPFYISDIQQSSIDVLKQNRGWVLIEDLHSSYMQKGERIFWGARENARHWIENSFKPLAAITDNQPNFPYTRESNRIRLYYINKNQGQKK